MAQAGIAQSVEHFTRNEGVVGSSPISSLNGFSRESQWFPGFFCVKKRGKVHQKALFPVPNDSMIILPHVHVILLRLLSAHPMLLWMLRFPDRSWYMRIHLCSCWSYLQCLSLLYQECLLPD